MRAARELPAITPENERYWRALEEGRVEMQRCSDCGYVRHPPRWICPECLSEAFDWTELSGEGEIHSFIWYFQSFDERFADVPYNVAVVELAEGPRVVTNVVGVEPGDLEVGQAVAAVFEPVGERAILLFRLAGN